MNPFAHKTFIGDFFDVLNSTDEEHQTDALFPSGCTKRREAVISILSGDFGIKNLPDLTVSLDALLTSLVRLIVLDLSQVTELCPNAVGTLINYQASVEGRGKRLILFRPSSAAAKTLAELNIAHMFEIRQTEQDLLLALPD